MAIRKLSIPISMASFFATSLIRAHNSLLLLGILLCTLRITGAQSIGVCNGMIGNNLPPAQEVIDIYKSNGIGKMRIYYPHKQTLQALRGSNIELILDVPRENLQSLATNASDWVQRNVVAYSPNVKFQYISVGNEIDPSEELAQYILPAIKNVQNALASANLQDQIKVSTAVAPSLLENSFPPSAGVFKGTTSSFINPIIQFLASNGSPLLANVYTYFSYIANPRDIDITYALLTSPTVMVQDGDKRYQNLFDANLDALYAAMEKAGGPNVEIVVSESGWPSKGGMAATVDNARTYYSNLINHVKGGTPKKPGQVVETYLFAMFDENMKGGNEVERHFSLFLPNNQPKYQIGKSLAIERCSWVE